MALQQGLQALLRRAPGPAAPAVPLSHSAPLRCPLPMRRMQVTSCQTSPAICLSVILQTTTWCSVMLHPTCAVEEDLIWWERKVSCELYTRERHHVSVYSVNAVRAHQLHGVLLDDQVYEQGGQ